MPAYFDTGFCVRTPSWHGEERLLADYPETVAEARELAGLTWEPEARPNYALDLNSNVAPVYAYDGVAADGTACNDPELAVAGHWVARGSLIEDVDQMRVVRNDTGALLDVTKKSRAIITNADMLSLAEVFMGMPNVKFDTLGSVEGGKKVYATIVLDEPKVITGPKTGNSDNSLTLPYLVLQNQHSFGGALRAGYLDFRIVCANTYGAAEISQDRHGHTFKFSHTKNWRASVDEAKAALAGLRKNDIAYTEVMGDLLDIRITDVQAEVFVQDFIPMPVGEVISPTVKRNVAAARAQLRTILGSETTAPVSHTAYGLVQAAGEYLDHYRGSRSVETKVGRQLLTPQSAKNKAIRIARDAATYDGSAAALLDANAALVNA